MLTFEDFFLKKKIDLQQLQHAEPTLFAEFSKHYPLMGEKSFDHTKKYWFNNLRRSYPLAEQPKPHKVQAEAISQTAVQAIAVAAAQNLNEAIERPKFKEDNLADLVEENVPEQEVSLAEEEKLIVEDQPKTDTEITTAKPAFKPRFNAKNIKNPEEESVETPEPIINTKPETEKPQPETEKVKPAFKPRFNMQNIKKEPVKTASEIEVEKPVFEASAIENAEPAVEQKPAYKPRFQMKNVKPAEQKTEPKITSTKPVTENPQNIEKEQVKTVPENESYTLEKETEDEPKSETEPAKPAYKPRFQMKNMPKPPTE